MRALLLFDRPLFTSCADRQHIMFMEVMGRYAPPIPEILADDTPGVTKTCVDLGCGSGSWCARTIPTECRTSFFCF